VLEGEECRHAEERNEERKRDCKRCADATTLGQRTAATRCRSTTEEGWRRRRRCGRGRGVEREWAGVRVVMRDAKARLVQKHKATLR